MRTTHILALMAFCAGHAHAQTLIDSAFGQADQAVHEKNGRVTGKLPAGWTDNSGWARVWVDYSSAQDADKKYLRIKVSRFEDGRVQLAHRLPKLDADAYYRLTFTARSPDRSSVQFGIREAGAPYTMHWEHTPRLGPGWTTRTIDFRFGKRDSAVWFMILLDGAGEAHFSSLKLERRTREELLEDIKKKHPEPGAGNFLRQSTFPLGMPCGWSLNREFSDGDDVIIEPGTSGIAPATTALAVKPKARFVIHSAPFEAPRALEPHTASIHVRGSGDGKLIVTSDGRWLASKPFKATGEWARVALTFKPALLAQAHAITLEGSAAMEFDGVQVNAGDKPTAFAMQQACEVHLSAPSPARVYFNDEPAKLAYAVIGSIPAGARLKLKTTDALGQASPGEVVDVDRAARGSIDLGVYLREKLGPFRIEAWAADNAGKAISPVSETVIYRLHRPRYWEKDAPDSPFGTHTLAAARHMVMAKAVGVNWVRLHDAGTVYAGWRYVEKEKGQWTFNDEPLNRYRKQNLKILGALATSPNWATNFQKPHNSYFDQFYQPRDLNDYANYVKTVAARYRGVIDTWDVWNEPWNDEWWAVRFDEEKGKKDSKLGYIPSEKPEADFARMVDVAVKSAKEVEPSLRVLGINSTTGGTGKKWTAGIVAADGYKRPDIYCYHQYTSAANLFPGDSVEHGFQAAVGEVREKLGGKLDKPVWMTEGSAMRDRIGSGMYLHTFPAGAGEEFVATSDSLCRYVVSLLANGCSKVFLYSMHGHNTFGNGGEWRVLVTDEGYLHPSAAAHSNMAWHLEDTKFVKRIEPVAGAGAYIFAGKGRSVAVISNSTPRAIEYPVLADPALRAVDLFGNSTKASKTLGATLVYVSIEGDVNRLEAMLTGVKR